MKTQEEFKTCYDIYLRPKLVALEKQRENIVSKKRSVLAIYSVLMIVIVLAMVGIFTVSVEHCELDILAIAATIFGMILITWETIYFNKKLKSGYTKHFKQTIIRSLVNLVDENLVYDPNRKVPLKAFHTSQLFKRKYGQYPNRKVPLKAFPSQLFKRKYGQEIDKWTGEDYFEGTFGKTSMIFSEVKAREERGRGDYIYYVTIFRGLFFEFELNLNFKGVTLIVPYHKLNIIGPGKLWPSGNNKKRQITLEDPELARNFVIYSDNPTMAHRILTTDFMHRLLTLRHRLKKPLYLSFVDGKLYLAIHVKKNLFESKLSKSVLNFELIQECFEYIQLGKEIVEMLQDVSIHFNTPSLPI